MRIKPIALRMKGYSGLGIYVMWMLPEAELRLAIWINLGFWVIGIKFL